MNKLIKKIIKKLIGIIYLFIENIYNSSFLTNYLIEKPLGNSSTYIKLNKEAEKNTYSLKEVLEFEKKMGYSIDKKWISELALYTQVVIKKSALNYAHGRILYSVLSNYLSKNLKEIKSLNIVETGLHVAFQHFVWQKHCKMLIQKQKYAQ